MQDTKIQWADNTWNPWIGCTKVSAGCKNCYAEADMDKRKGRVVWGVNGTRSVTSYSYWREPLKWNREAEKTGIRKRVFCASLADVFEDWNGQVVDAKGVPLWWPEYGNLDADMIPVFATKSNTTEKEGSVPLTLRIVRAWLMELIYRTPNLDWLLLTKRPENIKNMVPDDWMKLGFPDNVWIGTSVEDQEAADKRIPELLKVPAVVRFLSCEPLLGPLGISKYLSEGITSMPYLVGNNSTNEIEKQRGNCLPSSNKWGVENRPARENMEGSTEGLFEMDQTNSDRAMQTDKEGRTRHGQLFACSNNVGGQEDGSISTPISLSALQRLDTGGVDSKPQEREKEKQQSPKSGVSNTFRTNNTCDSCIENITGRESEEREKQHVQVDEYSDRRNKGEENGRTDIKGNSSDVQHCISNSIKDSTGGTQNSLISWCIIGGESGHNARRMQPWWATKLILQCEVAKVPVLFKQWGEYDVYGRKVGKKQAGRTINGKTYDGLPVISQK